MKKVYIIIAILASLLLAAMLIGIGYGMNKALSPRVEVNTQVPTATPTPEPEITPTPTPDYVAEAKKKNKVLKVINFICDKKHIPHLIVGTHILNFPNHFIFCHGIQPPFGLL